VKAVEQYVRLCGRIGNFSERLTGVSIVDAYFGPPSLAPENQTGGPEPESILQDIGSLIDNIEGTIRNQLRREYLLGETRSLQAVVEWLSGADISYGQLVKRLFNIDMKAYTEIAIDQQIQRVDEVFIGFPGADVRERADRFMTTGELRGEPLKNLIEGELQDKASEVGRLFKERVFSKIGGDIRDKGVRYKAVTDKPWGGYNYYLGGFKSMNEFNVDHPMNREVSLSVIYHEYEHHVNNLFRERAYLKNRYLELSVVPLHTGRSVISEGTADSAKEFLGIADESPTARAFEELSSLRRMVSINAAIMMNDRGVGVEEVTPYIAERGFRPTDSARATTDFFKPKTDDGRVNIWAPYVFTYHVGKTDFVMPKFEKAVEKGLVEDFFRVLYLNPFSGSSVTWKAAFDWL
jgi:hypothetical protein